MGLLIAGMIGCVLLSGGRVAARVPEILAFGDSLTAGFGLAAEDAFPKQLEAKLKVEGLNVRVVDAGLSGDTTSDGLARLDWALAEKPELVLLELGANDMLRGVDPKLVRANLAAMLDKIQASGAGVLLLGMKSVANWGADYQRRFDALYPELAKAHGVALYPFFLDGVALDPKLNQPDGLHPNKRGVAALVGHIAPVVAKLIGGRS